MVLLEEEDWRREIPFLLIAAALHGALLSSDAGLHWRRPRRAERVVPVEFVAALPPAPAPVARVPGPALAPVPRGKDQAHSPKKGPGEYKPASVKKPDAFAGPRPQAGARASAPPRPAPRVDAEAAAQKARRQAARRAEMNAAKVQAESAREERLRRSRERAAFMAAERAAEARADAERRALERAESARRAREALAARSRRRAELSAALASMANPDEALSDAVADAPGPGAIGGSPRGRGALEAAVARPGGDPTAPSAAAEPVYEIARDGSGASDAPASGGGMGPEGGAAWSLDGPIGSRRVLSRPLPSSPDWVSQRGLELSVQIRFQVTAEGAVKGGAQIRRTSGFPEVDRRALEALKRWRFQSVRGGETWGQVTFRFLMG